MPTMIQSNVHDAIAQVKAYSAVAAYLSSHPGAEAFIDNAEAVFDNAMQVEAKVTSILVDPQVSFDPNTGLAKLHAQLVLPQTTLGLPGFEDAAIVYGGSANPLDLSISVKIPTAQTPGYAAHLTLTNIALSLRFRSSLLRKVIKQSGNWIVADPSDAVIALTGASIDADGSGLVAIVPPAIAPSAMQIGSTGVVLEVKAIQILTGEETNPPANVPHGTKGVYIADADVYLPPMLHGLAPDALNAEKLVIGTGGLTGTIGSKWTSGSKPITIGDFACALQTLTFEFKQNALTDATLKCELTIPFFDNLVDLDVSVANDGALHAAFSHTQPPASAGGGTYDGGLLKLQKAGIYTAELESVAFSLDAGVARLSLSGTVTPAVPNFTWPTLAVDELSVDSKGRVTFDAGWTHVPLAHSFDFHGAKLEITQFTMGVTAAGERYIGMNGKLELIKGLPASASVDGLRIAWTSGGNVSVTFDGIGVSSKTKALELDGSVSYHQDGDAHRYTGDITVKIPAADDLELIGKAVFGVDADHHKYFAIYLEGDFGTGIPLWATGLSLYGIAGLVAVNYGPNKPSTMPWFSIDHDNSWYHAGTVGVTDLAKWTTAPGTFAIGAGVTLGTAADNGYAFNGKFLLLLLCPGPVLMIDGSARFLEKRDAAGDPPFHALIVLDNRAGYFLVGIDARWKSDKAQGTLTDISGSMEAFFDFHDPRNWHLYLGKNQPMDQRIQARFAKLYTAKAYFMLDAYRLQFGLWIGYSGSYTRGPAHAALDAYLDADVVVNFKPAQFHGDLHLHGFIDVKVMKFGLTITLDAILSADVFHPYHILGELDFAIEAKL